jgi:hypothetical protein
MLHSLQLQPAALNKEQVLQHQVLELLYETIFIVEVSHLFAHVRIEDTSLSSIAASQDAIACTGQGNLTRTYAPTHGLVHASFLADCPIMEDQRSIGHPCTSHSNTLTSRSGFNC